MATNVKKGNKANKKSTGLMVDMKSLPWDGLSAGPNDFYKKYPSDPYAEIPSGYNLENVNMLGDTSPTLVDEMKYQSTPMGGQVKDAFTASGVSLQNKQFGVDMPGSEEYGQYTNGGVVGSDLLPGSGGLGSLTSIGSRDSSKYGSMYKDDSGKYMNKNMFLPDSEAGIGDFKSLEDYQSAGFGKDMTSDQFRQSKFDQGRLDNQSFQNNMGLGLGVAGLASNLYSTFGSNGSMAMNKKNMQLMDQQMANNSDLMATRKARNADIAKYFG